MARRLTPWMWSALAVQLATGGMLIPNRPVRYFENGAFQAKMALLLAAVGLTAVLARGLARGEDFWSARPWPRRLIAGAALMLWLGVILAGRWIAYV